MKRFDFILSPICVCVWMFACTCVWVHALTITIIYLSMASDYFPTYQGAEVVRMYKTLLGSQGFRKVCFWKCPTLELLLISWINMSCTKKLLTLELVIESFCPYFREWIFILRDMMGKLWPAKTFLLPCEMQMMQILLIFYYGMDCHLLIWVVSDSFNANVFTYNENFRYSQAGTPRVKVTSSYNAETRAYSLKFRYTF